MTTIKAFNEMMGQFLDDISGSFPEDKAIQDARAAKRDGRDPYDRFMKQIGPWIVPMMQRNDSFFCEENEFCKELELHIIWKREDCTDKCKAAIWQWLSSLYTISMTLSMFPPETLAMLESAAEGVAKNMQQKAKQGKPMSEAALMSGVNDMLSTMMSSGMFPPGALPSPKAKPNKPGKKSR